MLKKCYERTTQSILKHQSKDKPLFIKTMDGWGLAIASKSKTKTGVKYRRMARLIRKLRQAKAKV